MESSISRALIMVAGVLLAMLVIAFITLSFRRMGTWVEEADQEVLIEQVQKFNKEYEVYDKDLMYGVDVISCLNKAKSNNDKIDGKYAEQIDSSYEIKVKVKLKKTLNESIRVYHMNNSGKQEEYVGTQGPNENKKLNEIFNVSTKYSSAGISNINFGSKLKNISELTKVVNGDYILAHNNSSTEILALLECSDEVKQTVKNTSSNSSNPNSWTIAEWETPLFDLKTRKFTCTNIGYDAKTGRVNQIDFEEKL